MDGRVGYTKIRTVPWNFKKRETIHFENLEIRI